MTIPKNAITYGRNFDGSAGDVLDKLKDVLEHTPPNALATVPLKRVLLAATVAEIERLRAIERDASAGAGS